MKKVLSLFLSLSLIVCIAFAGASPAMADEVYDILFEDNQKEEIEHSVIDEIIEMCIRDRRYVSELHTPVIAEGGIWVPEQLKKAIDIGVHSAVVGTAITRPRDITKHFAEVLL